MCKGHLSNPNRLIVIRNDLNDLPALSLQKLYVQYILYTVYIYYNSIHYMYISIIIAYTTILNHSGRNSSYYISFMRRTLLLSMHTTIKLYYTISSSI